MFVRPDVHRHNVDVRLPQVTSPNYDLPRHSNSRHVSINVDDSSGSGRRTKRSPESTMPPSTRPSSRPRSALRFLAPESERRDTNDERQAEQRYREALAPQREHVLQYMGKCDGYIGGFAKAVSTLEATLGSVQRRCAVSRDASRQEVRRLMEELDRERRTTKKLSLAVDLKEQKIQELAQALKTEQVCVREYESCQVVCDRHAGTQAGRQAGREGGREGGR